MHDLDIQMVPVDRIDTALRLQRGSPDEKTIERLKASIKRAGILNPILILEKLNEQAVYDLISGLHRLEAAKLVGLAEIPARILAEGNGITREILLDAVDEDTARKTVHPIEIAEMIRVMRGVGMTRQEIEDHLHFTGGHVNNLLRLLVLPKDLRAAIRTNQLAMAKGRALAGLQELNLPEAELHGIMRKLVAETTPNETCATFHRRVQDLKAERLGRARFHRQEKRIEDVIRLGRQAEQLERALKTISDDPECAADLAWTLQPLQAVIAGILERTEPVNEVANNAERD